MVGDTLLDPVEQEGKEALRVPGRRDNFIRVRLFFWLRFPQPLSNKRNFLIDGVGHHKNNFEQKFVDELNIVV